MASVSASTRRGVCAGAIAVALVLSACSTSPRPARVDAPPPETALPAGQTAVPSGPPTPPTDLETAVPAPEPGVGRWAKPGVSSAAYQGDVEACFTYAQAQIAHDRRIERDSTAAFETFPEGTNLPQLRDRMNEFERGNRRIDLFDDCMESKGYAPK